MTDPTHPLASSFRMSGIPRPSKLPRPQSVAVNNDPNPVPAQRAPLQNIRRPLSNQPPCGLFQDSLDGYPKTTRQLSQQENAAQVGIFEGAEDASVQSPNKGLRKSRPSLSDRAIETLSRVPPSPATDRRRSGFFSPQSSMTPRPLSMIADRTRPATAQSGRLSPTKPQMGERRAPTAGTPSRKSVFSVSTGLDIQNSRGTLAAGRISPVKSAARTIVTSNGKVGGTKNARISTIAAKPRVDRSGLSESVEPVKHIKPREVKAQATASDIQDQSESTKASKSSNALRQQIAKARAARLSAATKPSAFGTEFDTGLSFEDLDDPFNQGLNKEHDLLRKRINSARLDGRLNISALGLKALPQDVLHMYDSDVMEAANVTWSGVVDLVRVNAADNEIEKLSDEFFPDERLRSLEDDIVRVNPFCGVEILDLHGNLLSRIPEGLKKLERLTSLNLSRNKLDNSSFDVISELSDLRELYMAENDLTREVPSSIGNLSHLESLDLHGNKISSLPTSLCQLTALKIIDISSNRVSSLPTSLLQKLPLRQILASTNAFTGALFDSSINSLPLLEILDVSSNSIASLSFNDKFELPALLKLNMSQNRLSSLPDVSSWKNLISLHMEGNGLASLPEGFTSLFALKTANFIGNNITRIDDEVADMKVLDHLALGGNPLREKKFLTMSADEIKADLKNRIAFNNTTEHLNTDNSEVMEWMLSPNGVLDLSSNLLDDLNVADIEAFLASNSAPRSLVLAQNKLSALPLQSLGVLSSTLTILDVSRNALAETFLKGSLFLPVLRELNLSGNKITSFECLLAGLNAPSLALLEMSRNRLSGSLPHLRATFGRLTQLNADDNAISEASADSLFGLQVVSLRGNDLTALDPEIGLLGEAGLRALEVRANKFRVPNHTVLDKGTQAVLAWLRMKLP